MALTVTEQPLSGTQSPAGTGYKVFDVVASADADTGAQITHGMTYTPRNVILVPLRDEFYTSRWYVSGLNFANITLTKATAGGSGTAAAQIRVIAFYSGA